MRKKVVVACLKFSVLSWRNWGRPRKKLASCGYRNLWELTAAIRRNVLCACWMPSWQYLGWVLYRTYWCIFLKIYDSSLRMLRCHERLIFRRPVLCALRAEWRTKSRAVPSWALGILTPWKPQAICFVANGEIILSSYKAWILKIRTRVNRLEVNYDPGLWWMKAQNLQIENNFVVYVWSFKLSFILLFLSAFFFFCAVCFN